MTHSRSQSCCKTSTSKCNPDEANTTECSANVQPRLEDNVELKYFEFTEDIIKANKEGYDTKLVKTISGMQSVSLLQDLWLVIKWLQANNMLLHETKFQVLHYVLNSSSLLRQLPFTSICKEYVTSQGHGLKPDRSSLGPWRPGKGWLVVAPH